MRRNWRKGRKKRGRSKRRRRRRWSRKRRRRKYRMRRERIGNGKSPLESYGSYFLNIRPPWESSICQTRI